jgi:hypothetical protein
VHNIKDLSLANLVLAVARRIKVTLVARSVSRGAEY